MAQMKIKMDAMEKNQIVIEKRLAEMDELEKQRSTEIDVLKKRLSALEQQQGKGLFTPSGSLSKKRQFQNV